MNSNTVHYSSDNTPYYIVPDTGNILPDSGSIEPEKKQSELIKTYTIDYDPLKIYQDVTPMHDKYNKLRNKYKDLKKKYSDCLKELNNVNDKFYNYTHEFNVLQNEYNTTKDIQKNLYKELETKTDENYNLRSEINSLKTTNDVLNSFESYEKVVNDQYLNPSNECNDKLSTAPGLSVGSGVSFDDESYWKDINLDKLEIDAYAKVNNQQKYELTKLRNTLKRTRKYSKKLLKKNRDLRKSISYNQSYNQPFLSQNINSGYLIKDEFKKDDEFIFRNCCLNILYGNMSSNAIFTPETTFYDLDYWNLYPEWQCKIIVKSLHFNYSQCIDFNTYIKTTDQTISYLEQLKCIVAWLFCESV